jgi:CheY-like chemotaxis protein
MSQDFLEQDPVRVLVVDDERMVAESLARILRGRGFESRAAYSAEEAVILLPAWRPHAVITDVIMGKMDGVSLAMHLSQALPSCRVLLMSGNNLTTDLLNQSELLGYQFPILAKPFHPDRVFEFLIGRNALPTA